MWEDDGSDFGGQANGDLTDSAGLDSAGALDLGHSELMYGNFMDPTTACDSGGWAGPFDSSGPASAGLNQLQSDLHHHQPYHGHSQHDYRHQYSVGDQDEAALAAAGIEESANIHAGIIEDSPADEHKVLIYDQAEDAAAAAPHLARSIQHQQPQQGGLLPSVPELASWWGSGSSGRQAVVTEGHRSIDGVGASDNGWAPDMMSHQQQQQQHMHQNQPLQPSESVSEREFIIVRKAKASVGWDGSAVSEAAVVYECRICGRQCRWRSSISVHVRTHTGRKPYQCRVCHHRFADSSTRKKHEKKTHGCIIPGNKKATGFDGQMAAAAASGSLPHQRQPEANPTCHLCFAMLPSQSELTKHLYEYHNHLSPVDFGAPLGSAADEIPLLHSSVRRPIVRNPEPPPPPPPPPQQQQQPVFPHQLVGGGHSVWPEFDDPCHQQQQQQPPQQQHSVGIPLPAVSQSVVREIDQNIGAVDQQPDQQNHQHHNQHRQLLQQQQQQQLQHHPDGQDLLYPYEIGCLGRDLHGIESILDDGQLSSYNQHLEFDKLDW